MNYQVAILLLVSFHIGDAFRGGAPVSECEGMNPSHGSSSPQPGSAPVDVTFKPSCYKPGVALNVTLRSSTSFKGVLFQIRKQGTSQIVDGAFENFDKNLYKLMNCPPGVKNSVTHSSKAKKTELKFTWLSKAVENVELVYTYLESFDKFWLKQVKAVSKC